MSSSLSLTWATLSAALGLDSNTPKPVPTKGAGSASTPDIGKPKVPSSIRSYKKGIYTVWEHVPVWTDSIPGSSILRDLESFRASFPYIGILLRDLWSLGPLLCTTYLVANMFQSVLPAMKLAQTSRLLSLLEKAMLTKNVDQGAFYVAIVLQVVLTAVQWAVSSSHNILYTGSVGVYQCIPPVRTLYITVPQCTLAGSVMVLMQYMGGH